MPNAAALAPPIHHAVSDIGLVHHVQEDSWSVLRTGDAGDLYIVCDGMGGMGHGDEASQLAIRILTQRLSGGMTDPAAEVATALSAVDVQVRTELCAHGRGLPGTTAVVAYLRGGVAHVGWVGDSRVYWIRDGHTLIRTRDHKLVEELVALGQLTQEEARGSPLAHVVTRAIGGRSPDDPAVEASVYAPWELQPGDTVLLCSDGLSDLASDEEIAAATVGTTPKEASERLLKLALDRGGHDNITVVTVRVPGGPARANPPRQEGEPEDEFRSQNLDLVPWLLTGGLLGALVLLAVSLLTMG